MMARGGVPGEIESGARSPARWVPALIVLAALPALGGGEKAQRNVSEEDLNRIQLECLKAYSSDLLSEMTDGEARLPAELERKPEKLWGNLAPVTMEKGEFFPTVLQDILPMLERYVTPGKRFLDLGSGDGRVVFLANLLGADAHGIEYEKRLVEASLRAQSAISDLVDPARIRFINGDFFESPWSDYDVIFYFNASTPETDRFHRKLVSELKPGARFIVASGPRALEGLELEVREGGVAVFRKPST